MNENEIREQEKRKEEKNGCRRGWYLCGIPHDDDDEETFFSLFLFMKYFQQKKKERMLNSNSRSILFHF